MHIESNLRHRKKTRVDCYAVLSVFTHKSQRLGGGYISSHEIGKNTPDIYTLKGRVKFLTQIEIETGKQY